jgi:hypothetical protein
MRKISLNASRYIAKLRKFNVSREFKEIEVLE